MPLNTSHRTTSVRSLAEGGDPVALQRLRPRNTRRQRHPGGYENEHRRRDRAAGIGASPSFRQHQRVCS